MSRSSGPVRTWLGLTATLVLLAGCGGSSSSSSNLPNGNGGNPSDSIQGVATPTTVAVVTATNSG